MVGNKRAGEGPSNQLFVVARGNVPYTVNYLILDPT